MGSPENPKPASIKQAAIDTCKAKLAEDEQLQECSIHSLIHRNKTTKLLQEDRWTPKDPPQPTSPDNAKGPTKSGKPQDKNDESQEREEPTSDHSNGDTEQPDNPKPTNTIPVSQPQDELNTEVVKLILANLGKQYLCPNQECDFTSNSETITLDHRKYQCEYTTDKKTDSFRSGNLPEYEVIQKSRTVHKLKDDNNMLLCEARAWSLPANWLAHQNIAIRGQKDLLRWNYNTDKVGLTVRNRRTTLEAHDPGFTDFRLCQFTDEALAKASGTVKPIQNKSKDTGMEWKEDHEPIPTNGLDQALKAWRNWVDLNRFIHPGLLDCHAAYRVLQDNDIGLTVNALEVFFTRHLENRANATTNGAGITIMLQHQPPRTH